MERGVICWGRIMVNRTPVTVTAPPSWWRRMRWSPASRGEPSLDGVSAASEATMGPVTL